MRTIHFWPLYIWRSKFTNVHKSKVRIIQLNSLVGLNVWFNTTRGQQFEWALWCVTVTVWKQNKTIQVINLQHWLETTRRNFCCLVAALFFFFFGGGTNENCISTSLLDFTTGSSKLLVNALLNIWCANRIYYIWTKWFYI